MLICYFNNQKIWGFLCIWVACIKLLITHSPSVGWEPYYLPRGRWRPGLKGLVMLKRRWSGQERFQFSHSDPPQQLLIPASCLCSLVSLGLWKAFPPCLPPCSWETEEPVNLRAHPSPTVLHLQTSGFHDPRCMDWWAMGTQPVSRHLWVSGCLWPQPPSPALLSVKWYTRGLSWALSHWQQVKAHHCLP